MRSARRHSLRLSSLLSCVMKSSLAVCSLFLLLQGLRAEAAGSGRISGMIIAARGAAAAGQPVFFFAAETGPVPSPDRYWRVPSRVVNTDDDGSFAADLPEGRYYAGAMRGRRGGPAGHPRGDGFRFFRSDSNGRPEALQIRAGQTVDLGRIVLDLLPHQPRLNDGRATAFEGVVLDQAGKPLEGAVVYAHPDRLMKGDVIYISEQTGKDGRYVLGVPGEGTYFLQVRDVLSGRPYVMRKSDSGASGFPIRAGEAMHGVDLEVGGFPVSQPDSR